MQFKIKVHSIVDVITNSSSVIYTWEDGSDKALKKMIDEFLKSIGSPLKFEDMFFAKVVPDLDSLDNIFDSDDEDEQDEELSDVRKIYEEDDGMAYFRDETEKFIRDEIPEPKWMKALREHENYNGYNTDTSLVIIPKDSKYKELAEKIVGFFRTRDQEASYDG